MNLQAIILTNYYLFEPAGNLLTTLRLPLVSVSLSAPAAEELVAPNIFVPKAGEFQLFLEVGSAVIDIDQRREEREETH